MNNKIKITLDVDGTEAGKSIDELNSRYDKLKKEIAEPLEININSPAAEVTENYNRLNILLEELRRFAGTPFFVPNLYSVNLSENKKSGSERDGNHSTSQIYPVPVKSDKNEKLPDDYRKDIKTGNTAPVNVIVNSDLPGVEKEKVNVSLLYNEIRGAVNNSFLHNSSFQHVNSYNDNKSDDRFVKNNAKELKQAAENYTEYQVKITSTEKKYSSQRERIVSGENSHKTQSIELMFQSAELLFSRQASAYKLLSIAEATISAYNAANAALLPPPIGAGPILGEIQAGIVLMNGLKRVEKIAAAQIPGYAKGGIVVGEKGPEVIENMQDYASGRAELIQKTILALQNINTGGSGLAPQIISEIKNMRSDLNKAVNRPAIAFLDDKEAKKVYYRGGYIARKTR